MNEQKRAYLELHVAVALWGFTAILGKLIQLDAIVLVWWRTMLTCLVFLAASRVWAEVRQLPRSVVVNFLAIGVLLMLHWLCFYGSIKLANASVAVVCVGIVAVFSAFLEPLLNRSPFKWHEIALSGVIVLGIWLVAKEIEKMNPSALATGQNFTLGFWLGILGSFFVAFVSVFNKRMVEKASPFAMSFLEMAGGWLSLSVALPIFMLFFPATKVLPSAMDWVYLPFFVIFCTNIAQVLCFRALKHVSAFAANLTINLEPLYGIIFAVIFLKENQQLTPMFYLGAAIVILSVVSYPFLKKRFE
ncbi:MAG: hypothetical protein RL757_3147 [Bacteroidota bacterium]|jgi:drug/metabolite transporter (DMT)-like permease